MARPRREGGALEEMVARWTRRWRALVATRGRDGGAMESSTGGALDSSTRGDLARDWRSRSDSIENRVAVYQLPFFIVVQQSAL